MYLIVCSCEKVYVSFNKTGRGLWSSGYSSSRPKESNILTFRVRIQQETTNVSHANSARSCL